MTKEELDAAIAKAAADAAATATANVTKLFDVQLAKRDAEIAILKMTATEKAFYDGCGDEATKKSFADMSPADREKFMANKVKKDDTVTGEDLAKRDEILKTALGENAVLKKRLDAMDLEKSQETFKKRAADLGLTKDGDGELMRKAFSGDVEAGVLFEKRQAEVVKGLTEQVKTGKLFSEFGTTHAPTGKAYDLIVAKGEELRKADTKLTKEQAFTKAYAGNPDLVAQHKQETAAALN